MSLDSRHLKSPKINAAFSKGQTFSKTLESVRGAGHQGLQPPEPGVSRSTSATFPEIIECNIFWKVQSFKRVQPTLQI